MKERGAAFPGVIMTPAPVEASSNRHPKDRVPEGLDRRGPVRNRSLTRFSSEDILSLAYRAAEASLERLREIAHNADPEDGPLRRLLGRITSEREEQVRFLGHLEMPRPSSPSRFLEGGIVEETLRENFISHVCPFGEGYLDRDAAFYFVESTTLELGRLFALLGEETPDEALGGTFEELAQAETSQLAFLRAVILEDKRSWIDERAAHPPIPHGGSHTS